MIEGLKRWALAGPILLYSIILHEMAHGYVALLNGDPTALEQGRLTLNPIPHIDLWGSILIPLLLILARSPFFIAWARPVDVDPSRFVTSPRLASLEVALAGPFTNMLLAIFFAAVLRLSGPALLRRRWGPAVRVMLVYGVLWNTMLMIFNFLPIPPLDGFRIIEFLFPAVARSPLFNNFALSLMFLVLIMTVARRYLLAPIRRVSGWLLAWADRPARESLS